MKKQDLVEIVASKTGESNKVVSTIIDTMIDVIGDQLKNNEPVDIYGFAKFESVQQNARLVRNPKTGEIKENPAKLVPKCRFKSAIKNRLN